MTWQLQHRLSSSRNILGRSLLLNICAFLCVFLNLQLGRGVSRQTIVAIFSKLAQYRMRPWSQTGHQCKFDSLSCVGGDCRDKHPKATLWPSMINTNMSCHGQRVNTQAHYNSRACHQSTSGFAHVMLWPIKTPSSLNQGWASTRSTRQLSAHLLLAKHVGSLDARLGSLLRNDLPVKANSQTTNPIKPHRLLQFQLIHLNSLSLGQDRVSIQEFQQPRGKHTLKFASGH